MHAGRLGSLVEMHTFPNASHLGILQDDRAVRYIVGIITKPRTWRIRLRSMLHSWGWLA